MCQKEQKKKIFFDIITLDLYIELHWLFIYITCILQTAILRQKKKKKKDQVNFCPTRKRKKKSVLDIINFRI